MTIGEANDVNLVLDYFLGRTDPRIRRVDHALAAGAAARLAGRAYKALSAGITEARVLEAMVATTPRGDEPSEADALATIRFAVTNGVASSANYHLLTAGPKTDALIEDVLYYLLNPSTRWALAAVSRPEGTPE